MRDNVIHDPCRGGTLFVRASAHHGFLVVRSLSTQRVAGEVRASGSLPSCVIAAFVASASLGIVRAGTVPASAMRDEGATHTPPA